jgi:hypothetical protein
MIGGYKACSLFSTMGDFKTQADAVAVAGAVMQALFNEENRAETDRAADIRAAREAEVAAADPPPLDPEPSRRAVHRRHRKPGDRPLMLDTAGIWRVEAQEGPRAERLAAGKPVGEARDLLGRVFNLCRAAQTAGFDIATGSRAETAAIAAELRRDHLMQIFMAWPRTLGLTPQFDRDWLTDDHAALVALFGPTARAPRSDFEMAGFLGSEDGVGPLLHLIGEIFGPRTAIADGLPLVDAETAFRAVPVENSPAARQAAHPALSYVEATVRPRPPVARGRSGPRPCHDPRRPPPRPVPAPEGCAIVPATRGYYAVSVGTVDGHVKTLSRVTPTDHMLAPGGALEAMLSTLPPDRAMLLPVLMTLVDPCRPLNVEAATQCMRCRSSKACADPRGSGARPCRRPDHPRARRDRALCRGRETGAGIRLGRGHARVASRGGGADDARPAGPRHVFRLRRGCGDRTPPGPLSRLRRGKADADGRR